MPRRYPSDIHRQVVELARSGTKVAQLVVTFGMSEATIYNWLRQEQIDRGEISGTSTDYGARSRRSQAPHPSARDRARRLPEGQRGLPRAGLAPKRLYPVIASLTGQGNNVRHACRFLGVTESGYYAWRSRPTSPRALRRIFLAGQITEVHRDSAGVYGAHRITAELRFGRQIVAGHNAVAAIMRDLGIKGLPNRRLPRGARVGRVGGPDLVRREFARQAPDELWMTDITEHPTREGKIYCCVVLDAFSRRVVGWSIDSTQTTLLVTNALGMATRRRDPAGGLVIHSDRGVQFTSWSFSQKVREAGLAPSIGAIGCPYDNAAVEAFWGRMQVELLNRKRWKTRIELASAIHDYIELFHNSRRRHSALGMLTPTEYEDRYFRTHDAA